MKEHDKRAERGGIIDDEVSTGGGSDRVRFTQSRLSLLETRSLPIPVLTSLLQTQNLAIAFFRTATQRLS